MLWPGLSLREYIHHQLHQLQSGFVALIRGFAVTAIEQKELPGDEDPDRLAFELNGIIQVLQSRFHCGFPLASGE